MSTPERARYMHWTYSIRRPNDEFSAPISAKDAHGIRAAIRRFEHSLRADSARPWHKQRTATSI